MKNTISEKRPENGEARWFRVFALLPQTMTDSDTTIWLRHYWSKRIYEKLHNHWIPIEASLDEPRWPKGFDKATGINTKA